MRNPLVKMGVSWRRDLVRCLAVFAASALSFVGLGEDTPIPPPVAATSANHAGLIAERSDVATNGENAAIKSEATVTPPAVKRGTNQVDVTLREAHETLESSNLIPKSESSGHEGDAQEFQRRLDQARKQRREKDSAAAEKNLAWLVQSTAPDELKRSALLELALLAQDNQQFVRAQQVFAQYLKTVPEDPSVPEVMLRQGLLYRQMGAPTLALSKFYSVMSASLKLKLDQFDYYQSLVLQAQTEIAETYYLQGKFVEAADFFARLLKLDNAQLNKPLIHYKLLRSFSALGRHSETVAQASHFLSRYPETTEVPEVRFLLADSLRRQGRNREAMEQVLVLLQTQQATAATNPETWTYWQRRTGNDIGNQLYKEGDYQNALEIYLSLGKLNDSPAWQLPVWYQIGLIYERLRQPEKASLSYNQIIGREKEIGTNSPSPSLVAMVDMARWRLNNLDWATRAELASRKILGTPATTNALIATP